MLLEHIAEIVAICKEHDVVVGHPHADANNIQRIIDEGFRFIMPGPVRSYEGLERGLELTGRA